jgi:hypothetical protein
MRVAPSLTEGLQALAWIMQHQRLLQTFPVLFEFCRELLEKNPNHAPSQQGNQLATALAFAQQMGAPHHNDAASAYLGVLQQAGHVLSDGGLLQQAEHLLSDGGLLQKAEHMLSDGGLWASRVIPKVKSVVQHDLEALNRLLPQSLRMLQVERDIQSLMQNPLPLAPTPRH